MQKTSNIYLNKPENDDKVRILDLNQNADNLDDKVSTLQIQMATKAPIHNPTFTGLVLAPKPGTENGNEIHEQVITTGYMNDALTVEVIE